MFLNVSSGFSWCNSNLSWKGSSVEPYLAKRFHTCNHRNSRGSGNLWNEARSHVVWFLILTNPTHIRTCLHEAHKCPESAVAMLPWLVTLYSVRVRASWAMPCTNPFVFKLSQHSTCLHNNPGEKKDTSSSDLILPHSGCRPHQPCHSPMIQQLPPLLAPHGIYIIH